MADYIYPHAAVACSTSKPPAQNTYVLTAYATRGAWADARCVFACVAAVCVGIVADRLCEDQGAARAAPPAVPVLVALWRSDVSDILLLQVRKMYVNMSHAWCRLLLQVRAESIGHLYRRSTPSMYVLGTPTRMSWRKMALRWLG